MAGRLWTKGIGWKKTATKLLSECHMYAQHPMEERCIDKPHMPKSRHISTCMGVKSMINVNRSFACSNSFNHSSVCNESKLSDKLAFSIVQQCGIHSAIPDFEDAVSDRKNVGIISSMFEEKEHSSVKGSEEKADEKEGDDKDGEKRESPFLRSQRIAKWILLGSFTISTPLLIFEFGPPKRDEFGEIIADQFSDDPILVAYIKRAWSEIRLVEKDIVEPSSQKLLPEPLQEPYYQPPYTLVIELFDVLLHPVYDQVHGWRFKKRPGIDYFLSQVGPPYYEIVIFTRETGMTAFPLVDSMDPKGYIMYRLFRDAARFKSGFTVGNILKGEWPKLDPYYQKDLKYLNRDLNRVVIVDNDKRATELQPNNGITLKPWDGSVTDTELYDLAAFLRTIAVSEVDDIRPVLEHYRKYDNPLAAFKLAQTRMQEEQEKLAKQSMENKAKQFTPSPSGGFSLLTKYFRANN